MQDIEIKILTPEYYGAASKLLADTFKDEPLYIYFFQDSAEISVSIQMDFFTPVIGMEGESLIALHGDVVVGGALLIPAKKKLMFYLRLIAADWKFSMNYLIPTRSEGKFSWKLKFSDGLAMSMYGLRMRKHYPRKKKYWMLGGLAVGSEFRRCGVGRALVRESVSRVLEGQYLFFQSMSAKNLEFYRRCGFEPTAVREPDWEEPTIYSFEYSFEELRGLGSRRIAEHDEERK